MRVELQTPDLIPSTGSAGESRAYVLLETARLRCEALMERFGRREHLVSIHREIGLAGYVICADFTEGERRQCLVLASSRLGDEQLPTADRRPPVSPSPEIGPTLARMFSETISASDALAGELAAHDVENEDRDRLHLVHAHVMSACELLDERLTVLELQGAPVDAAH